MSVEKNNQQQNDIKQTKTSNKSDVSGKVANGLLVKFTLLISCVALGVSGYVLFNSIQQTTSLNASLQRDIDFDNQIKAIKTSQDQQKTAFNELNEQNDLLSHSVKAIQSQLVNINSQIATPSEDLAMQTSLTNIQNAISYLILAKDVMIFEGNTKKASDLINSAFDKIQASRIANVSASERQKINNDLQNYSSKDVIIKDFINIENLMTKLEYLTPENISNVAKSNASENKYLSFLKSFIEIQDIPKNQTLVATQQSKELIASSLYRSLIALQNAMYINSQDAIDNAKNNIITIVKKYFVQNDNTKNFINAIQNIKAKNMDNFVSIDELIDKLSTQQNQILSQQLNSMKINTSSEGTK